MHLTVCSCHVTYAFQSESTLYIYLNFKELLARNRREFWSLSDCNWIRTHNHLVHKRTLNHLAKLAKWLSCVVSTYLYGAFDCMFLSCHVRVSEWIHTLYLPEFQGTPCTKQARILKFKWLQLIRTHNHLVHKRTLNHLAKLAKWLSCVVSTYLYGAFDCMFLSCHVRVSEWIHTLYLPEFQGTPCTKQARILKFKWLQLDSNPQPLSS